MKKFYIGVCMCILLAMTGCDNQNDMNTELEKADSVETVQEELGTVVLNGIENASKMTVYKTNEQNGKIYELTNTEVNDFLNIVEDIHVIEKNADTSSAFNDKITIKVYSEDDYGWTEICALSEADGNVYMAKGWNDDGEYIYYKMRSDKLSDWLENIKASAENYIPSTAW